MMGSPTVSMRGTWRTRARVAGAIVGVFLAGFFAFGIGAYAFTQFLGPLQAEFGWSRAVLGGLMTAFWTAAPFVLVAAYALDHVGIRRMVFAGAVIEAGALAWLTGAHLPVEFYAIRFLMGVGKCFTLTPLSVAIARWFPTRTGLVLGISLCGWHAGGMALAPFAAWLVGAHGWRYAALALAALLVTGMAAASFLMRDPGLHATGRGTQTRDPRAAPVAFAPVAVLVIVGISTLAYYAGYAGLLSQLSPMLADVGLGPQQVGNAMAAVAAFALAGTILSGVTTQWLTPRQSGGVVLALMGAVEAGATLLHHGAGQGAVIGVVVLLGLLVGGGDPILIEVVRRTVPDRAFARMYGLWYFICLVGLAAAPLFAGALFDLYGDYRMAFLTLGALTGVCAVAWIWRLAGIGKAA